MDKDGVVLAGCFLMLLTYLWPPMGLFILACALPIVIYAIVALCYLPFDLWQRLVARRRGPR